jgi:Fur family peroxide stress response transcriptional regulator
MRLTKHRQEIIQVLETSHGALSAADIKVSLPHINLVTIYRNLDTFAAAGIIKKLYLGDTEARFEKQHTPHHHAICDDCNRVIHFTLNDKELAKQFSISDFSIKDIEVTVHGVCTHKHQSH